MTTPTHARSVVLLTTFVIAAGASAGTPCESGLLIADDGASGDDLGAAISLDGVIAVAGAPEDDDAGSSSGAAYVFRFTGSEWTQEQKLTASDADNGDDYGFGVAVSGDTIVVGSPRDDTIAGSRAGSAYVYRLNGGTGMWEEEAHLFALDAAADDRFGTSVAIDGDTIVVGATQDDDVLANAGAGYVFVRTGVVWSQQDKLTATGPTGTNPQLGRSAGIDGDVVALGAWQSAPAGMFSVGAAYVFRRVGTSWSQDQKLTASDAADFRWFGQSVAVSGAVVAVGAYGDRADDLSESGGAYLFRYDGATWLEEDNINASVPADGDRFGWSIDVDGDTAIVGSGTSSARAWLFTFDGADWNEEAELLSVAPGLSSEYGYSVAIDAGAGRAVVGDRGGGATGSGLGVVFDLACAPPCPADLDGSGDVGFGDILAVIGAWGPCGAPCPEDLSGNGNVDFADILAIIAAWGPC
ncbi:MAG: hypothetical protein GY715_15395 [Planctomycetes bacterium]|nr:hypothetical protein [Planctomycetota bacterium]